MSLIRNWKDTAERAKGPRLGGFILTALIAAMPGCSTRQPVRYEPVERTPVVGDDAMALRQWPPSYSYYANGATAGWSTRYPLTTIKNGVESQNIVMEPILFIGETILLPVEFVANPPFVPQVYHGVEYRPTYSFQPPLPSSRTSGSQTSGSQTFGSTSTGSGY